MVLTSHDLVRGLNAVAAADRAAVGGKGASLGELLRAGIPVPPGFMVTVAAFELALAALDPAGDMRREIESLPAGDTSLIARVTAQVRARIIAAPLPAQVEDEIIAHYRVLGGTGSVGGGADHTKAGFAGGGGGHGDGGGAGSGGRRAESGGAGSGGRRAESGGAGSGGRRAESGSAGSGGRRADGGGGRDGADDSGRAGPAGGEGVPVAVRSSATGEDSAEASFAGLQDTYLWVSGAEAVVDHVRRCWASLYNAEAIGYRLRMKTPEHNVAMAVVVQRMVEPRCAGVMFTRSPVTGDRSVIAVEGSWGLGSALVNGEVTPDTFVISKVTGEIVRRTVATKLRLHRRDPAGSGVIAEDVPEPLRDRPCLGDSEIAALAQIGRRVEDLYGVPQDIEWAITDNAGNGDGVVLLQSRPETAWARRPAAPVAAPRPRAVDHVFEQLGRVNRVTRER